MEFKEQVKFFWEILHKFDQGDLEHQQAAARLKEIGVFTDEQIQRLLISAEKDSLEDEE